MKRSILTAVVVASAMAGAATVPLLRGTATVSAQQRACLHGEDETAADKQRRSEALGTARSVNTAQAYMSSRNNGKYVSMQELVNVPAKEQGSIRLPPSGFEIRLTNDGSSYAFSVKDKSDACRFAYFSDQDGVIFSAEPIR